FLRAVAQHLGTTAAKDQVDATAGTDGRAWYRAMTATAPGGMTVAVTVTRGVSSMTTTSGTAQSDGQVVGSLSHPTGNSGFLVTINVTGPVGWTPPFNAMAALAADARLTAVG
ncbi:MAG: hypothetical protein ABI301_03245, partial [Jatrophihabitantaceae bacterium]